MAMPTALGARRVRFWPASAVLLLGVAVGLRWLGACFCTPVVRGSSGGERGDSLARSAYGSEKAYQAILRRDPYVQESMQQWIRQQKKVIAREEGVEKNVRKPEETNAKQAAYLKSLGLGNKVEEAAKKAATINPWHFGHTAAGDVYVGTFSHPEIRGGSPNDVKVTMTSETEGQWQSAKGNFVGPVTVTQDWTIAHPPGADRNREMAIYCFQKLNRQWRKFTEPVPPVAEMETLGWGGLKVFFKLIADVDDFPTEKVFKEAVADPEKGMTIDEFLKFLLAEDPDYLETSFPGLYTGRRVRFFDEELTLDLDFQADLAGFVMGYVELNGEGGGFSTLRLQQR